MDFLLNSAEHQEQIWGIYKKLIKVLSIATLPIYLEAVFCLLYKSPHFDKTYIILLTANVVLSYSAQFYGGILLGPVVIVPFIGFYASGILQTMFHVNPLIQLTVFYMIFHANAAVMNHLFIQRLKMIVPPTWKHCDFVCRVFTVFLTISYLCAILPIFTSLLLIEDQYSAKMYYVTTYRDVPINFWTDAYALNSARSREFSISMTISSLTFVYYAIALIASISLIILIFHGVGSTIALLLSNKPYREIMRGQISKSLANPIVYVSLN
ncbi:unnamed protein product [Caenorhabditis bovis]|uniref:Serpentine Receptor, class H n=1 Tax=Caenorhabditis bovis TaxID=2654633 RepID=A0A8S1EGZ8_9PELO|nr:unnamed protein product [Caenorhabditis bovis]